MSRKGQNMLVTIHTQGAPSVTYMTTKGTQKHDDVMSLILARRLGDNRTTLQDIVDEREKRNQWCPILDGE